MISGKEEARLIYLGVLWSMPKLKGSFGIVDIGGGSTEVIMGDRHAITFAESYKLGAARLTQRFFKKDYRHKKLCVNCMMKCAACFDRLRHGCKNLAACNS